jgi:hypothetical protein
LDLYREAQLNYRKEVRKASKNAWRAFCSSIDDLPRSAKLQRALSRDPKLKLGSLMAPDGQAYAVRRENLRALAHYTFLQFRGYTGVSSPCGCPPD